MTGHAPSSSPTFKKLRSALSTVNAFFSVGSNYSSSSSRGGSGSKALVHGSGACSANATTTGSGSSSSNLDSPQKAIQSCRDAIIILNKQELSLQTQVNIAEAEARAMLRLGDRSGAETSLKKREIVLREIDRLHRTRMSLLSQILLVETASTRQVAVEALASGVAAHRRMSHKLYEETQLDKLEDALIEQASFEMEISGLLGQGFEAISNFDDDTTMNIKRSLAELEHDEVVNALSVASNYQGCCTAEPYESNAVAQAAVANVPANTPPMLAVLPVANPSAPSIPAAAQNATTDVLHFTEMNGMSPTSQTTNRNCFRSNGIAILGASGGGTALTFQEQSSQLSKTSPRQLAAAKVTTARLSPLKGPSASLITNHGISDKDEVELIVLADDGHLKSSSKAAAVRRITTPLTSGGGLLANATPESVAAVSCAKEQLVLKFDEEGENVAASMTSTMATTPGQNGCCSAAADGEGETVHDDEEVLCTTGTATMTEIIVNDSSS